MSSSEWCTALILRFSYQAALIPHESHSFAHLSINAAEFIHSEMPTIALAVQAPSVDRAACKGCDVHRVLFGLRRDPPQIDLEPSEIPSTFLIGENFEISADIEDGKYVLDLDGLDVREQDATVSCSSLFRVAKDHL